MAGSERATPAPRERTPLEPMHSNVVNYLVWRYLQEAGFGMAATWLGKEWHRQPDEVMPFAQNIKQRQLVYMLQDALFVDNVRSQGNRKHRKYYFGDDPGPDYALPVYDIAGERELPMMSNGHISKRSSRKHRGLPMNGDVMDIDDGYGGSDQMSETDSQLATTQDVPLLDTLTISVDRSVNTEKPRDLLSDTVFLHWPRKADVSSAQWSRDEPGPLLVAGLDTLRLFAIPPNDNDQMMTRDIEITPGKFEVEAITWLDQGSAVASVASLQDSVSDQWNRTLVHITNWGTERAKPVANLAGLVFSLRYNPKSKFLISITGGVRTSISIYLTTSDNLTLLCTRDLDTVSLYDAAWMSSTRFITCGTNILQIYEFVPITNELRLLQSHDMQRSWFRIKYDSVCSVAVFASEDFSLLRQYDVETEDTKTQSFYDARLVDGFDFQPIEGPQSLLSSPRLLATATVEGTVQLWDVLRPFTCLYRLSLRAQGMMDVHFGSLAWSPSGDMLAAGGFNTVGVWQAPNNHQLQQEHPQQNGDIATNHDIISGPLAIWHCHDRINWRGMHVDLEDEQSDWTSSIHWEVDGKRLVFASFDQACVISVV